VLALLSTGSGVNGAFGTAGSSFTERHDAGSATGPVRFASDDKEVATSGTASGNTSKTNTSPVSWVSQQFQLFQALNGDQTLRGSHQIDNTTGEAHFVASEVADAYNTFGWVIGVVTPADAGMSAFHVKEATGATGTGALSAQAAAIDGAGTSSSTGTGALNAQAAAISGEGNVTGGTITGTGILGAQPASIVGAGISKSIGTGILTAQSASTSGTGISQSTGAGVLSSGDATISGTGTVQSGVVGVGILVAQSATIVGTGAVSGIGTAIVPSGVSRKKKTPVIHLNEAENRQDLATFLKSHLAEQRAVAIPAEAKPSRFTVKPSKTAELQKSQEESTTHTQQVNNRILMAMIASVYDSGD
jgi:hypothetical protein